MILPSKELLSEITGYTTIENIVVSSNNNICFHAYCERRINIYELMHMMKEWLKRKGCCIDMLDRNNGLCDITLRYGIDFDYKKFFSYKKGLDGDLPSEVGGIFKACEWKLREIQK